MQLDSGYPRSGLKECRFSPCMDNACLQDHAFFCSILKNLHFTCLIAYQQHHKEFGKHNHNLSVSRKENLLRGDITNQRSRLISRRNAHAINSERSQFFKASKQNTEHRSYVPLGFS